MPRPALIMICCLCLAATAAFAAGEMELYRQVAGCEEKYQLVTTVNIYRLAQKKGLRWYVLAQQNKLKKPYHLKKGLTLRINDTHIVPNGLSSGIIINLPEKNLYYFKDGAYQRRYHLAVGKPDWPTPTGNYKICDKRKNPIWNVPESIQEEMWDQGLEVVEQVPPGPKNPLGKFFMATTADGVGIHATNRPGSVGSHASHGCIRMLPEEIEVLFPQIPLGTPVKIIYQPVKMALTTQGRIFLEAHPDIYRKKLKYPDLVKELARKNLLGDRIDWERVAKVLKAKEGVAHDVTLGPEEPKAATAPPSPPPPPRESSIFPLQRKAAKLE